MYFCPIDLTVQILVSDPCGICGILLDIVLMHITEFAQNFNMDRTIQANSLSPFFITGFETPLVKLKE